MLTLPQQDDKSELELVESAREGDSQAIGALYERYSSRVYSYIYLRLGNRAEAEDVTGQVFLKMLEKLPDFRWQGAGFAAWIFRIAHNQTVDALRKRSRVNEFPIEAGSDLLASDGTDPQRHAERSDTLAHLREAVARLSDLQAQVIVLKYAGELSNPEVAEIMSRTPNAVSSLHYEAIKNLGKILTEKGYTP